MNRVVLIGRLTKDPELRFTPGTGAAVATFTIAIDRNFTSKDGKREADFIPIVVWGKVAENTANYMSKGRLVGVSGRIQTRNYEAKDGTRRYVTEVVADEVQFLDRGNETSNKPQQQKYKGADYGSNSNEIDINSDDITPVDDGEIPF